MLLPNEWIENSIETYIYQHTTKSQVIYWVVLLAVTVTLVALPFIYVDISVQGSGVVRPVAEKAEITSSITEIVDSVFVKEGDQVNKGDVILRFRTDNSDYKINYQTSRKLKSQQNELASLVQSQLSTWQADQNTYRNTYNEMNSSLNQEIKDKDMYIVRSPVDGTVDQFSGVYRGSSIQAGQSLAVISPDSTLCLEVYVTPRNIGFMSVGMPVNVQVESFNYNEWGTILGRVKDISSDFLTDSQGNSFYKVKCEMERDYLQLKNGRVGKLKKGMTVNAHFMVTRRSLFDLLYQKMDGWVNPKQYENETMVAKLN